MADVIAFPTKRADDLFDRSNESAHRVADSEHNREGREGQGPPIGMTAWSCNHCGSFAFYITPKSWHCYGCHVPQTFD